MYAIYATKNAMFYVIQIRASIVDNNITRDTLWFNCHFILIPEMVCYFLNKIRLHHDLGKKQQQQHQKTVKLICE